MSGFRHIEIACDGPNGEPFECSNSFYALAHTMKGARREARACKWATGRPGGKDYCPECAAAHVKHP